MFQKLENVITKVQVYREKGYTERLIRTQIGSIDKQLLVYVTEVIMLFGS